MCGSNFESIQKFQNLAEFMIFDKICNIRDNYAHIPFGDMTSEKIQNCFDFLRWCTSLFLLCWDLIPCVDQILDPFKKI